MQLYAAFHPGLHCLPKYLGVTTVYKGLTGFVFNHNTNKQKYSLGYCQVAINPIKRKSNIHKIALLAK